MDFGFNFSMTEKEAELLSKIMNEYTDKNYSEQACIILARLNEQIKEVRGI